MMGELSLHLLDIVQNSIEAGAARIEIALEEDAAAGTLCLSIEDDGRGMTGEQLSRADDPFYTTRTTRRIGMGLPFLKMAAQLTGGGMRVRSAPGKGTKIEAEFFTKSIDMPPAGDLEETLVLLVATNPALDFAYTRSRDGRSFSLDTRALRGVLGGRAGLSRLEAAGWIREYLARALAAVTGMGTDGKGQP